MNSLVDVRDVLAAVQTPTLVLHRRHDNDASVEEGRYIAGHIPGARFIELEGTDHFVAVDPDQILDPVEDFVRGLGASAPVESSLTTLLAVHIEENLDVAWVRNILRELLDQHRGTPAIAEPTAVLATFDGPGRAVRCGLGLAERARPPTCTSRSGCTPPRSPGGAPTYPATVWPSPRPSPIVPRRARCG
jgi:hypothetical protein